ncbi:MAG: hypothetical protein WCB68_01650 [Pyrinomonadaceae bacterium]
MNEVSSPAGAKTDEPQRDRFRSFILFRSHYGDKSKDEGGRMKDERMTAKLEWLS